MDVPRRWQVGSLATAVTGLGIGAMLLGRPTIEPVEPIVLDEALATVAWPDSLTVVTTPEIAGPEIVTAEVLGATPATATSHDSPDGPDDHQTAGTGGREATPSAPATATTVPEDSVDSTSSADSD